MVIALFGNPFSPAYARARASGDAARALDFCALNVAVYGPNGRAWALRERRLGPDDRQADGASFGSSRISWENEALVVRIVEQTSPFGRPLRGRIVFRPLGPAREDVFLLDAAGAHRWWPVHPGGRIDVELDEPRVRFTGRGYQDANAGDVPLEDSFAHWSWSRAHVGAETRVTYDVTERSGATRSLAVAFDEQASAPVPLLELRAHPLGQTGWRMARSISAGADSSPRVVRDLEDTPFYARALIETRLGGRSSLAMHEALSLERFRRSWVRFLLGFRMATTRE